MKTAAAPQFRQQVTVHRPFAVSHLYPFTLPLPTFSLLQDEHTISIIVSAPPGGLLWRRGRSAAHGWSTSLFSSARAVALFVP